MSEVDLLEQARKLLPDVIALRRRIHQNPELGLHTTETRDAVLAALADLDLEWIHSRETSGVDLTLIGVGAMIGAGSFVPAGSAAGSRRSGRRGVDGVEGE